MAQHPVARFRQVFDARLRSGKYEPIDVVQAVKGLTTSAQLVQSLDIFCARFDPEKPPGSRNTFELCRTTGFNLFKRALDLSDAQNELLGMVLSFGSTTAPKLKDAQLAKRFSGYRKRWDVLNAKNRDQLQRQAKELSSDHRAEAAKRRLLLDDLEKEFRNRRGHAPQGKELFGFDPGPAGARGEFERLATACEVAFIPKNPGTTGIWFLGQFIPQPGFKGQPQTSSVRAMQNVQSAFGAFARFVERQLNQPLDLFRLLAWAREPSSMYYTAEMKAGKQNARPHRPWSNVWFELYQDIAVRGVVVAVNDWTVAPMIQARGYAGKDLQFILAPLDAKQQELLTVRLADAFSTRGASYPKPAFNDAQSARRQAKVWGDTKGLDLVDELEYASLMQDLAAQVRADPKEVLARKISITGVPSVYQESYHIYESAKDVFTVVWIPKQVGTQIAYIEVHALPGLYFQAWGNRVGLDKLLEDHAYGELAKAAAALVQFLLVYLDVLGYALDIATAGVSGGLRHVIFRFVEERIKDKFVSEGLELTGIDDPWVKAVVGLAVGMTPSVLGGPKVGALKGLEELDRGAQNVMRFPPAVRHTPHVAEREGSAAVSSHAEPTIPQTKLPANDNALIRGTAAPANDNRLAEPGDLAGAQTRGLGGGLTGALPGDLARAESRGPAAASAEARMGEIVEPKGMTKAGGAGRQFDAPWLDRAATPPAAGQRAVGEVERAVDDAGDAAASAGRQRTLPGPPRPAAEPAGVGPAHEPHQQQLLHQDQQRLRQQQQLQQQQQRQQAQMQQEVNQHSTPQQQQQARHGGDPGRKGTAGQGVGERATAGRLHGQPSALPDLPPGTRMSPSGHVMITEETCALLDPLRKAGFEIRHTGLKAPKSGGAAFQGKHATGLDHEWKVSRGELKADIDGLAADPLKPGGLVNVEAKATFVKDVDRSAHLAFYPDKVESLTRQLALSLESRGLLRMEILCNAREVAEVYQNMIQQQIVREVRKRFLDQARAYIEHATDQAVKRLRLADLERIVEDHITVTISDWGTLR